MSLSGGLVMFSEIEKGREYNRSKKQVKIKWDYFSIPFSDNSQNRHCLPQLK